jgi:hypothetical protein
VPATYPTCWLAGGGSTIRGVPETGSCEEFVCTSYKGQKGTFAIMADGKVRFISESVLRNQPDVFRAMCTIAGGEEIEDFDKVAPVVPANTTVLRPGVPGDKPKPPDGDKPKPPEDKPKPPTDPRPEVKIPEGWIKYTDPKKMFSVVLPRVPQANIDEHWFIEATDNSPVTSLTISTSGWPNVTEAKEWLRTSLTISTSGWPNVTEAKEWLRKAIDLAKDPGYKNWNLKQVKFQGHDAWEYEYLNADTKGRGLFILAGKRVWHINGSLYDKPDRKALDTVFDSFRLLEK